MIMVKIILSCLAKNNVVKGNNINIDYMNSIIALDSFKANYCFITIINL